MLFSNKFRAYRAYQPADSSLKTNGLRKTDTSELMNIVCNYDLSTYPTGLKQNKGKNFGATTGQTF